MGMDWACHAVQADDRLGDVVAGTWRLEQRLGTGLLGSLYATRDPAGRPRALRLLHASLAAEATLAARFVTDARAANAAAHPDCLPVLADGTSETDEPFVVTELLEGESIARLLERRGGRLPPAEALRIARDALIVLEAAHAQRLVHHGLRPETLFVTEDGTVKVLDLGLTRVRAEAARHFGLPCPPGSAAFTPPERARDPNIADDPRSDIWAVGALLFALLTGQPVHEGDEAAQLERSATRTARSLVSVSPRAPGSLCSLVDRALEYETERRFASARAMRLTMEHVMLLPELARLRSLGDATPMPRSGKVLTGNIPEPAAPASERAAFTAAEPATGVRPARTWERADTIPAFSTDAVPPSSREELGRALTERPPSAPGSEIAAARAGLSPRRPEALDWVDPNDAEARAELARTERQLSALVQFDTRPELEDCWRAARTREADAPREPWQSRLLDALGLDDSLELDAAARTAFAARLSGDDQVSTARFNALVTTALEGVQRRRPGDLPALLGALERDDPQAVEHARSKGLLASDLVAGPDSAPSSAPLAADAELELAPGSMPAPISGKPLDARLAFYAAALVVTRSAYAELGASETALLKLRKVAQGLVQALPADARLAELTTLASAYRDDAARAVQSALVALLVARTVSDDPALLFRVALAALLVDAGRACLERDGRKLDADAPSITAALCLAAGGAQAGARACTVAAFESAWLERRAELGALRGSATGPLAGSRVVHVARAWLEQIAPRGSQSARSPVEALVSVAHAPDVDPTLLKLLVGAIGALPAGSVVELESGQWAVARSSAGAPSLMLVTKADGGARERALKLDERDPAARIARVLTGAEARFNTAQPLFQP
jgi:serine/threonine protein kinase